MPRQLQLSLLHDQRGDLVQAALSFPILILIALAVINLGLLGISGMNANNAANYGARQGSVAQSGAAGVASAAAWAKLNAAPVGEYAVAVSGSGTRGSRMLVTVSYRIPNYFAGIASLYGDGGPAFFERSTAATFRQEGW